MQAVVHTILDVDARPRQPSAVGLLARWLQRAHLLIARDDEAAFLPCVEIMTPVQLAIVIAPACLDELLSFLCHLVVQRRDAALARLTI